jgi:GNAT superfamily N-acetyltransferase
MNAHPSYAGRSIARQLLGRIVDIARQQNKPVRLVSSAMNLDSFSLYNRAGFVPRQLYQDMMLPKGISGITPPAHIRRCEAA